MKVTSVVMLVLLGAFGLHGAEAVSGSTIARVALSYEGSTLWAYATSRDPLGRNQWKCNIFVAEVLNEAGGSVPHGSWGTPIGTGEWRNPQSSYLTSDSCWTYSSTAELGDVAGSGGHVGIVTGTQQTTSGFQYRVETGDWGFRPDQTVAFWRYTC